MDHKGKENTQSLKGGKRMSTKKRVQIFSIILACIMIFTILQPLTLASELPTTPAVESNEDIEIDSSSGDINTMVNTEEGQLEENKVLPKSLDEGQNDEEQNDEEQNDEEQNDEEQNDEELADVEQKNEDSNLVNEDGGVNQGVKEEDLSKSKEADELQQGEKLAKASKVETTKTPTAENTKSQTKVDKMDSEQEMIHISSLSKSAVAYIGRALSPRTSLRSFIATNSSVEYVAPTEGLNLSKTASVYTPEADGRQIVKLDLRATATSNIVVNDYPADIILVFDNSSSLNGNMDTGGVTREVALKQAATNFVNSLSEHSPDSKLAVVLSKKKGTTNSDLLSVESQKDSILNWINQFNTNGNNVVAAGLERAVNLYQGIDYNPERPRIVILVTADTAGGNIRKGAIHQSAILKGNHSAVIYSIGVFSDSNKPTNEYLWRTSSNSPSSAALSGEDYMPNDSGSYYLTTMNTTRLNEIFQGIAEQLGTTLKDAIVKDYIDSRFDIVSESGEILNVGDTITLEGNTGTIKSDGNGIYVEWPPQEIAPESADHSIPAKDFTGSLYVKAKADFIGGNNIPTNSKNITGVYVNDVNIGSFPNPLVNVPFSLQVDDITDTIFLGETIPRNQAAAEKDMLVQSIDYDYPDGLFEYTWSENFTNTTKLDANKEYTLLLTAIPTDYISFTGDEWESITGGYKKDTGEIYHNAVGDVVTTTSDTGVYRINVHKGTLQIIKNIQNTVNPNQTFVFEIKQYSDTSKTTLVKTFYETIRVESGNSNTRTVINLAKGYYEVKEKSDWSWHYEPVGTTIVSDTLGMGSDSARNIGKITAQTEFTNRSKTIDWLTSIDYLVNSFAGGEN